MSATGQPSPHATPAARGPLSFLLSTLNYLLALAVLGVIVAASVPQWRAMTAPQPVELPHTMDAVDWSAPDSSPYCLACHYRVAPATAELDVRQGHPQNVKLNDDQIAAINAMGTVVGPGDTLICMSCHGLGQTDHDYMLPDTLVDGAFCERCHPGHYARGTPHDLRTSAPQEVNRLGQTVFEGGPCSACHLSHRYAREFEPCDLDPDGRCITCHSTYRCAADHARSVMDHPASRCSECHDPHDMTHGEFLKAPVTDVCTRCHEDYADGMAAGMHPMGHVDSPVPVELTAAGGSVGGDAFELTCLVCHSTHSANSQSLLVLDIESNELCLICHRAELMAKHPTGLLPGHGQLPVMTVAQQEVVAELGGRVGAGGELLCLSCHHMHGGLRQTPLLTFKPGASDACAACHQEQAAVIGSTHDLRTNFPDAQNVAGETALMGGACSACHRAHEYARAASPSAGDAHGRCVTCHQADECGESKRADGAMHPDTDCSECHDAHQPGHRSYLKLAADELCVSCHADQALVAGGPHDATLDPDQWAERATPLGLCLTCHVAHGGADADLLRVRDTAAANAHDGACLGCHADAAWRAESSVAALHPRSVSDQHVNIDVTLVPTDQGGRAQMGCQTCHDPHGGASPRHLARVAAGEHSEALCLRCHDNKALISLTGHSRERLADAEFETESCKPCHAMHAYPDDTWGQVLSPRFLKDQCGDAGGDSASCVPCLACHHPGGPAPIRAVDSHPEAVFVNVYEPNQPGYMPLFDRGGHVDPRGQVACRTCHLSHGRLDLLRRVAEAETLTDSEQSALRTQVRPFQTPNVCTECHGPAARVHFLRFHDSRWRASQRGQR